MVLDTHAWIWLVTGSHPFPKAWHEAIVADGAAPKISVVSVWEAHMLMENGRIQAKSIPEVTIRIWLETYPLEVLPLTFEAVLASRSLRFIHEDPADRFIAATAYVNKVPLATIDERLRQLDWLECLAM